MASPVPMQAKPMRDPGTAPPWLRSGGGMGSAPAAGAVGANGLASLGANTSPPPVMPPHRPNESTVSDPGWVFGKGLPSTHRPNVPAPDGGPTAADVAYGGMSSTQNVETRPAGTPWDFGAQTGLKGSKTFDFDWDPANPQFGPDAQGFMANATLGAGSRGSALKMSLRDANGNSLFDNGDGGGITNLTSGKLAKGKYSLQVDPTDPNATWNMGTVNGRDSNYYTNNGTVSNPGSGTGWSPGTAAPGSQAARDLSAAQWDAGADARWQDGQALNEGFGGAVTNPNGQNIQQTGREPLPGGIGSLTGGGSPPPNPLQRGGTPTMPGTPGLPGDQTGGTSPPPGGPTGGQSRWDQDLDFSGLNGIDTDFTGAATKGADAAYKGASQFFDEDFGRERQANESRLLAQGLQPGSEAFETAMSRMERGQNATRQNAAFQAQGVGHQQAGDLLLRALQTRQQGVNEKFGSTDRRLAGRGQDLQRDTTGLNATLANKRFGLDEDNQSFQQLMQLLAASRGGVNMPNFGGVAPLDVGGANSIASSNSNAAANRDATDRGNWAAILGGLAGKWL
jgi:hypothetical protein